MGNEFKMHIFRASPDLEFSQKLEVDIMMILSDLGIENPKFSMLPSRNPDSRDQDKLRVNFTLRDRDQSIKIFKHFMENPNLFEGKARAAIFLQKPESVFCRYADIEAANYERE